MSYLLQNDFKKIIQTENLLQLVGSDLTILSFAQNYAEALATSYLRQKYDTAKEFTDTNTWNVATVYTAETLIYLDASAYSAVATYALNTLTLQAGSVYLCTTAITVGEAFTPAHWALLGLQYAMFFVTLPFPEFNLYQIYVKGDQIFWKDKTYTCVQATILPTHQNVLDAGTYSAVVVGNIFPDDINFGLQNWGVGAAYIVASGTLPTNTTKWTSGDNRSSELVTHCINIALYLIHSRISSNNIPEHRTKARDESILWLKDAAEGKYITADIPVLQPKDGARIRFGGNVKATNFY
jgi:hypothetical protein